MILGDCKYSFIWHQVHRPLDEDFSLCLMQAFFADIYAEAKRAKPSAGHRALAAIAAMGKLQRHYTMNIDGLAETVGLTTWHPDTNPSGVQSVAHFFSHFLLAALSLGSCGDPVKKEHMSHDDSRCCGESSISPQPVRKGDVIRYSVKVLFNLMAHFCSTLLVHPFSWHAVIALQLLLCPLVWRVFRWTAMIGLNIISLPHHSAM
jgi:hypothetical protein